METVGVSLESASVVLEYYSQHVIRPLDGYYQPLNAYLARNGVKPDVEQQVLDSGSLLKTQDKKTPPTVLGKNAGHTKLPQIANFSVKLQPPWATPKPAQSNSADRDLAMDSGSQNLYQSVVDALHFRREVEGRFDDATVDASTPMSGTWDGSTVPSSKIDQQSLADANTIAQALRILQGDNAGAPGHAGGEFTQGIPGGTQRAINRDSRKPADSPLQVSTNWTWLTICLAPSNLR